MASMSLLAHPKANEAVVFSILGFLGFVERFECGLWCREWRLFAAETPFFKWLCSRLAAEALLYAPPRPPPGVSWRAVFQDLWPRRTLFSGTEEEDQITGSTPRFNIGVLARFRPPREGSTSDDKENSMAGQQFFLPLHQRLQLIRARDKDSQSAFKTLCEEGGWFSEAWKKPVAGGAEDKTEEDGEEEKGSTAAGMASAHIHRLDPGTGKVFAMAPGVGLREFNFDHVIADNGSQSSVFESSARALLTDFLNGYNATILVYGQTGSGKTFTMFGDEVACSSEDHHGLPKYFASGVRGIVPRAAAEVVAAVQTRRSAGLEARLFVSYVQVYGNEVTDLLKGGAPCGHSKVAAQRYVLSGEARRPIETVDDVTKVLIEGEAQKKKASTAMNERSSRAHTLFILTAECGGASTGQVVTSQLFLADLGGSERLKRSEVHGAVMTDHQGLVLGDRMREAIYINLGLLALKKCIDALNRGCRHIPYQDSKLTMLLSPALGGDSKTSVIVCGSVEHENAKETVQALRFGEACARVENSAKLNARGAGGLLEDIEQKIKELEGEIQRKERWEVQRVVRKDTNVEAGTFEAAMMEKRGGEVMNVGRVVGAEAEREQLEQLIVQRAELLGEDVDLKLAEAGFGNQFAASAVTALGGHAEKRFAAKSAGLRVKGKVVAEWKE
uniref:Kinesin motor domain-containing protein n=1 Tax=Rhizochromulina marina TaxID=1034831 RepID=A0A7S2WFN9_9STRA